MPMNLAMLRLPEKKILELTDIIKSFKGRKILEISEITDLTEYPKFVSLH